MTNSNPLIIKNAMETAFTPSLKSTGLTILLATDPSYAQTYDDCVRSSVNLSATALRKSYPKEYSSWHNRKSWAKSNGVHWHKGMDTFQGFLETNGPIPHKNWTLDRIDPQGAYTPENLRWADKETQSQNRTNASSIELNGNTFTVNELSAKTGKSPDAIRMGINRNPTSYISKLVFKPIVDDSYNGIRFDIEQWQWPENADHQHLNTMYHLPFLSGHHRLREMEKPRFFVELVAHEMSVRDFIKEHDIDEANRIEAQKDLALLRPMLVETQNFIDAINQRIAVVRQSSPPPEEDLYMTIFEGKKKDLPCKKSSNPWMEWAIPQSQPNVCSDFPERYAALKVKLLPLPCTLPNPCQ